MESRKHFVAIGDMHGALKVLVVGPSHPSHKVKFEVYVCMLYVSTIRIILDKKKVFIRHKRTGIQN